MSGKNDVTTMTYVQAGNALRQLKTEYDAAGRKTTEYATELRRLVGEQNAARLTLVELKEANRQATAAVTEAMSKVVISLPMHAYLEPAAQDRVIKAVRDALA